MDLDDLDPAELRTCLLLAMDFIVAHRVAQDHAYDLARITAARDTLERRVLLALTETDIAEMPAGWSWRHAAHEIAIKAAMAIVEEDRATAWATLQNQTRGQGRNRCMAALVQPHSNSLDAGLRHAQT